MDAGAGQGLGGHAALGGPDVGRTMLDPAGLGEELLKLALGDGANSGVGIEEDGAGTGGPLVEGE